MTRRRPGSESTIDVASRPTSAVRLGEPSTDDLTHLLDEISANFEVVVTEPRCFLFWRAVVPPHVHVVTSRRELEMLSVEDVCELV